MILPGSVSCTPPNYRWRSGGKTSTCSAAQPLVSVHGATQRRIPSDEWLVEWKVCELDLQELQLMEPRHSLDGVHSGLGGFLFPKPKSKLQRFLAEVGVALERLRSSPKTSASKQVVA